MVPSVLFLTLCFITLSSAQFSSSCFSDYSLSCLGCYSDPYGVAPENSTCTFCNLTVKSYSAYVCSTNAECAGLGGETVGIAGNVTTCGAPAFIPNCTACTGSNYKWCPSDRQCRHLTDFCQLSAESITAPAACATSCGDFGQAVTANGIAINSTACANAASGTCVQCSQFSIANATTNPVVVPLPGASTLCSPYCLPTPPTVVKSVQISNPTALCSAYCGLMVFLFPDICGSASGYANLTDCGAKCALATLGAVADNSGNTMYCRYNNLVFTLGSFAGIPNATTCAACTYSGGTICVASSSSGASTTTTTTSSSSTSSSVSLVCQLLLVVVCLIGTLYC